MSPQQYSLFPAWRHAHTEDGISSSLWTLTGPERNRHARLGGSDSPMIRAQIMGGKEASLDSATRGGLESFAVMPPREEVWIVADMIYMSARVYLTQSTVDYVTERTLP